MKKHKKNHRQRIKYKGAGQHKTKSSGHLHARHSPIGGRAIKVLAGAAIVCIGIAVFFSLKLLLDTGDQTLIPVREPIRSEEEIAELKKEEMDLAEKMMRDFGANENSLMIMGNVLHRYGDAAEAVKFYERVLKINPKRPDIYNVMGEFSLSEGKFEDAIEYWRKALSINPAIVNVHSNIGHALMILGKRDEALAEFEKEIQISPNSDLTYFLLGQAYVQDKEYEKAKKNYEKAIKINPEHANAYYGLATVYTRLGDSDKAKECSEKFKKLKADTRKDLKGRKLVYDDFVETQKLAALTFIEAAQIYSNAGQSDKAEGFLKQAAALDPENVVCLLELASIYQKNGQQSKVLHLYKKIIEIEPGNPQYQRFYRLIQQSN